MDIRQALPGLENSEAEYHYERFKQPGYDDVYRLFGEPILEVTDADYQGDTRVILRGKDGRYGVLVFGWGSCSGCDTMQACESYDELQKIADGMETDIIWRDSATDLLNYFETHDWEGDYSWHYEEQKTFVAQAKEKLRAIVEGAQ